MALKYHPDKNGNTEESKTAFQKLQHIYSILSHPEKRSKYDDLGYYKEDDEDDDDDDDGFFADDVTDDVTSMTYDQIKKVLESVMKQMKLDPSKMCETIDKNKSSLRYSPVEIDEDWSVSTVRKEIQRINALGKIFHVHWVKRGITKLPGSVPAGCEFGNVEKLFLDKNKIECLPSGFFTSLSKLSVLSLEQNRLTEIPKCIFSLTELRELNLSYNRIEKIPKEIGKLEKLRVLNLFANRLSAVPPEVCGMKSLVELDLDCNDIVEVPAGLRESRNIIVHLPMSVESALCCVPPKKKAKVVKPKKVVQKKKQQKKKAK